MNSSRTSMLAQLRILHGAFCAGVVLFGGVAAFLVHQDGPLGDASLAQPLMMVAAVLAVSGLAASVFLTNRLLEKARQQPDVAGKLVAYRSAFIIGVALLEGPALFAVVAYLLTGNVIVLAIVAVLVLRMLMMRPTRDKIATALGLQYDEVDAM